LLRVALEQLGHAIVQFGQLGLVGLDLAVGAVDLRCDDACGAQHLVELDYGVPRNAGGRRTVDALVIGACGKGLDDFVKVTLKRIVEFGLVQLELSVAVET